MNMQDISISDITSQNFPISLSNTKIKDKNDFCVQSRPFLSWKCILQIYCIWLHIKKFTIKFDIIIYWNYLRYKYWVTSSWLDNYTAHKRCGRYIICYFDFTEYPYRKRNIYLKHYEYCCLIFIPNSSLICHTPVLAPFLLVYVRWFILRYINTCWQYKAKVILMEQGVMVNEQVTTYSQGSRTQVSPPFALSYSIPDKLL